MEDFPYIAMFNFCPNAKLANFSCRPIFLDLQYMLAHNNIIAYHDILKRNRSFSEVVIVCNNTTNTAKICRATILNRNHGLNVC